MQQKIVFVDGFHIRTVFGDMDFNIIHASGISFHIPWYILPGEILVEQLVKDEFSFLMKTEKLERKLDSKYPNDYQTVRMLVKKQLCKKTSKSHIRKTYRHKGLLVHEVDGGIVRRSLDPDFVSGGHYLIYPDYISKGEIWLDGKLNPKELPYILKHESTECHLMQQGASYIHAHDKAIHAEKLARVHDNFAFFIPHNPFRHLPFVSFKPHIRPRLLITAGIHGDEPSGTFALATMLRDPKKSKIFMNKPLDILPLLNPQGFARNTRENLEDQDLNRYFGDHEQIDEPEESVLLKSYFSRKKYHYNLFLSLHEDTERKKIYLYDTNNGEKSPLVRKLFGIARNMNIVRYSGLDDPELGNIARNGYINIKPKDASPSFEEYVSRHSIARRVLTLEIPGKISLESKIKFVNDTIKNVCQNFQ